MPDPEADGLVKVSNACHDAFVRAANDKRSQLRWPLLVTRGVESGAEGRIVVLRRYDRATRTIEIWTDRRSRKVAELSADPNTSLVFFDRSKMVQMRANGVARIVFEGQEWEDAFARAGQASLDDYTTELAPGAELAETEITRQVSLAREMFTQILIRVDTIDWLSLSRDGHRRALIDWRDEGTHSWRVP
ncbi:MAG: pyridoxamine 5'-phosphate oxidase family protein [Pseudomonadota bacterium]